MYNGVDDLGNHPQCIDIVIVNWNAGRQLGCCLASIKCFDNGNISKVIVVDNGSVDDSVDELGNYDFQLEVIRNKNNLGFARACNQGAALCDSPYLLFLNPDMELFENSLAVPLSFMQDEVNNNVGICGIQLIDKKGNITRTCASMPTLMRFFNQIFGLNRLPFLKGTGLHMNDWDHQSDRVVDHVIGAFFFVRKSVFEKLSGFDERFFVYLEDIDFSFRARQLNWKTIYLAGAKAFHEGGGLSRQVKARRLFYSLRSRLLYGFKNFSLWQAWILLGLMLFIEPFFRTIFSFFRGGFIDLKNTLSAYRMLYLDLPNILSKSFVWQGK